MRKGSDAYRQETQLADLCSKEACKVNTCRSNCTEHTNLQSREAQMWWISSDISRADAAACLP